VKAVKKYVDLILTILPFEKDWYSKNGIENVEYVGSPLAREVHSNVSKSDFCRSHAIDPDRPIVSLLPGSRQKEISRILPLMLRAAYEIELVRPETQFIIALSSTKYEQLAINELNKLAKAGHGPMNLPVVALNETYEVLNASDAAAVTSGTATLETGIIGTPMVVVYKTSSVNYKLLEPMIDVPHFGLINLIAEQRVAMELIQDKFTPTALATELLRLLEPGENAAMRARLRTAADKLGHGGASLRAAKAILRTIGLLRSDEISPL
jgi:lipid-A-disaccharide synthase